MTRGGRLAAAVATAVVAHIALAAGPASAHPLGNFTVNTYSGLRIQPDQVVVDLVVDMAEVPALQARRTIDTDGDDKVDDAEASSYASRACSEAAGKVDVSIDGRRAPVRSTSAAVAFPPGTAGLPTLRLSCLLVAGTGDLGAERRIEFRNANHTDRVGWREVTAVGDRTTLTSTDVRPTSISDRLSTYPDDLLSSPPDQRSASVRARPGGPPAPAVPGVVPGARVVEPRGIDGATRRFTALVSRQDLSIGFGIVALGLALLLGAVHAFAPGHGKTVLAAYLVGQRGSLRQAGVIGLTVTATHTAGVLILGIVLSASTNLAPETLYPWLGMASGLLLAGIGVGLLSRAIRRAPLLVPAGASDRHHHDHNHHHDDGHGHGHGDHVRGVEWRTLVPMGLAGGLVPSPSALVVLLGAIALGRAWFGVALVVAYGLGMAATLTAAGLLLVRARGAVEHRLGGRLGSFARALPKLTAAAIIVGGLLLGLRGATQL